MLLLMPQLSLKGLFILLETSNPGASMILKEKTTSNVSISDKSLHLFKIFIIIKFKKHELGPIGCVIGATNKTVLNGEKIAK